MPSIESYGTGDLMVHINVWTPQALDKSQRKFFKSMLNDENFVPSPSTSDKSFLKKLKTCFLNIVL